MEFLAEYPRVELHLESTNRRVDVVTEGIDLAIRVRPPPLADSDLVMRTLSDRGQCLAAGSPLLERLGSPSSPSDLDRFPSVSVGRPQRHFAWNLIGPDGENARVDISPGTSPTA